MDYDVLLIHPPAIYDFRERAVFPGPIAYTVGGSTTQFITPSIGILSIAEYLDRNGYRVLVDNIGERMITTVGFDVKQHLANTSARVYAIGLHWCVHSQGAIETARLCKELHPDALVVMGGLTATVFSDEIVEKYKFVDAVIRGEAEKPFLKFMKALDQSDGFQEVPNLTFRNDEGELKSTPLMKPNTDLDEYDFTRLDLLEPKQALCPPGTLPSWTIPVSRGCSHNCVTCGGSAYSYKTYLGREKLALRSPEKIAEDLQKLSKQGVQLVFLCQDPRMGGRKYWRSLLTTLQNLDLQLSQLTMEVFYPPDEEYIRELSKIDIPIALSISPESGVEDVRNIHGRHYSNDELYNSIKLCKKYNIKIGSFSMLALANDTPETVEGTWKSWEKLCSMNINEDVPVDYAFGPMLLLDPGSPAFDHPKDNDYHLIFKNLEDYREGMSQPSWHQWISYETKHLDRDQIIKLTIDSLDYSINLRERCGFFSQAEAEMARYCFVEASKEIVDVVDRAMNIQDEAERSRELKSFQDSLERKLQDIIELQREKNSASR